MMSRERGAELAARMKRFVDKEIGHEEMFGDMSSAEVTQMLAAVETEMRRRDLHARGRLRPAGGRAVTHVMSGWPPPAARPDGPDHVMVPIRLERAGRRLWLRIRKEIYERLLAAAEGVEGPEDAGG